MTDDEQRRFEMHRDSLCRLFAAVVTNWAEQTERNKKEDVIPFLLAVEWAYMVGAVITVKSTGDSEANLIELARTVWAEHGAK
jgi:hypothetical protein